MDALKSLSKHRGAFYVSCAANMGAILFGSDAGGIGAIVALQRYGFVTSLILIYLALQ